MLAFCCDDRLEDERSLCDMSIDRVASECASEAASAESYHEQPHA